jgi:two-component sensor histidine kinase
MADDGWPDGPATDGDTRTFLTAVRGLSVARSLDEIVATATPAARRLLAADGVTFVLRDDDDCYYAAEDAISPLWTGRRFPLDQCISGWCMQTGRAVAIPDIYEDSRIPHDAYRPTFVRSLAMAPVRQPDPIAAMGAYWATHRPIAESELDVLQTMADAAALAIARVVSEDRRQTAAFARRESAHRTKNLLSVAISMLRQTGGSDVGEYRCLLESRLRSLETVQSILFESDRETIPLPELLSRLLDGFAAAHRIDIGCDAAVDLTIWEADTLSLIVNEASINAVKYGAWSRPEGRVGLTCRQVGRHLRLDWRESGGPPVSPPSSIGFGTRLIRSGIANLGGDVELKYPHEGFQLHCLFPLTRPMA